MMECAKRVLTLGAGRELIEGDFVMIRMESGSSALYLLRMIGLLGEFPISFLDQLEGYYDYNRRRITELVREGYLRDWKFMYSRRAIHSLSLTRKGLDAVKEYDPKRYALMKQHLFAPENAKGDRNKAIRLHRNAACFLMGTSIADKLAVDCTPPADPDEIFYYSTYMLNKRLDADSKGSRASGIVIGGGRFYVLYYLGRSNMRWNPEIESSFISRITDVMPGHCCGGQIFIAEDWSPAENIISHASNRYTSLIRFDDRVPSYLVTTDDYGKELFRAIVDVNAEISLFRKCEQYGLTDSGQMYYPLFALDNWAQLYAKGPWFTTRAIFCFDFQKPVVDRINRQNEPIHVLPGPLLIE